MHWLTDPVAHTYLYVNMHACTNTVQAYPMLYAPSRAILFKSRSMMMKVPVLPIPVLQWKQVQWTNSLELAGNSMLNTPTYIATCTQYRQTTDKHTHYTRTHTHTHTHLQCTTTGPGDSSNSLSCFCCWLTSSR